MQMKFKRITVYKVSLCITTDIDTHPFEREVLQVPQCDRIEQSVLHLGLYKYVRDGLQAIFPNINNFENFPWFGFSSF
jgi:hypothetical protein